MESLRLCCQSLGFSFEILNSASSFLRRVEESDLEIRSEILISACLVLAGKLNEDLDQRIRDIVNCVYVIESMETEVAGDLSIFMHMPKFSSKENSILAYNSVRGEVIKAE